MNTLLVNGCSATRSKPDETTWADHCCKHFGFTNYKNMAMRGAGNQYICDSTIYILETEQHSPVDTFVLIQWTSITRKDVTVSGEWYYNIKDEYTCVKETASDLYHVHSGGWLNYSWEHNRVTKKLFDQQYKMIDPRGMGIDSLLCFIKLQHYLESKGFSYAVTTNNYHFDELEPTNIHGEFHLGYFCKDLDLYKNFACKNWFYANKNQGINDYAFSMNQLHNRHATELAHKKFAEDAAIPYLQKFIH